MTAVVVLREVDKGNNHVPVKMQICHKRFGFHRSQLLNHTSGVAVGIKPLKFKPSTDFLIQILAMNYCMAKTWRMLQRNHAPYRQEYTLKFVR
jgi:hypothetical protein